MQENGNDNDKIFSYAPAPKRRSRALNRFESNTEKPFGISATGTVNEFVNTRFQIECKRIEISLYPNDSGQQDHPGIDREQRENIDQLRHEIDQLEKRSKQLYSRIRIFCEPKAIDMRRVDEYIMFKIDALHQNTQPKRNR